MTEQLYSKPFYYHLAFPSTYPIETKIIRLCFDKHVSLGVKHVLEPACGTGRLLEELPQHGFHVTGYDLSTEMVEFSKKRIAEAGLSEQVEVLQGDMATIRFDHKFDAALNFINSIGYLLSDKQLLAHLRLTGEALNPGGIYIINLGCASDEIGSQSWEINADGISGTVTWGMTSQDREKKLAYEFCRMELNDKGKEVKFKDDHTLRLWFYDDFKALIAQSGKFVLEAIYNEEGEPVPLNTEITGVHGNLYYVLKVK